MEYKVLTVQKYLKENSLDKLVEDYKIVATHHESEPLVILNYDMIESPKSDPIIHECRALTLDKRDWSVVARSFTRFFNYGEMVELTKDFDWNNFEASSKEDGSLIVMYHYEGEWRINTRGSFAKGRICEGGPSWEELFWTIVDKTTVNKECDKGTSYVFELCSGYNKIVRIYPEPQVFLLGMFDNIDGYDYHRVILEITANRIGVKYPSIVKFHSAQQVIDFLASSDLEATFEGYVLRDGSNMRLKIKSARYVALHHLRGNNDNLYLAKNLLPLILAGEDEEVVAYFPEATERFRHFRKIVEDEKVNLFKVWDESKDIASQKDFAQAILPRTKLASILFDARRQGVHPEVIWKVSADRILNILPRSS